MTKQFYFTFGSGNPVNYTGLSPTMILFLQNGVTALPPPPLAELSANTGIYGFTYGTTASIVFVIDGGVTLAIGSIRFITGSIDPILAIDQAIGYPTDSYGSTAVDPSTLFGKANRNQEFQEGDKYFNKSTAVWDIYNRGSTTLLIEKVLTNTVTEATVNTNT